ncbi:hypothetical protein OHJ21_25385 [Virgibacillus sp. LDC1]|nr:hypothetical protein [Virgibacillus sp. LDC1]
MENHSTSKNTDKDVMKTSKLQRSGSTQARIIDRLHERSQIYMNSAFRFTHQSSAHICIVLGDRALESMLMAMYIKDKNLTTPPHSLSLNDVVQLTGRESGLDLDTVMFIYSIHFLASFKDTAFLQKIQTAHLRRLLRRVDDVLANLSRRIATSSSGEYQSIFSK